MFFKSKFKTIAVAAVIASLLLAGFAVKSDAASITSMSASVPDDWGDGANVNIYVFTDEGIDVIHWYKDGTYETTTTHNGSTSGSVDMSLTGHIKGEKYTIEAIVEFSDGATIHTDSHSFRVYKPMYRTAVDGNNGVPQHPDVNGSVTLYSHYFDGQNIVMSGSVYAYNGSNDNVHCSSWFRHTEYDANGFPTGWQRTTNGPSGPIEPGMSYGAYSNSMTDYFVGGSIDPDDAYYLNAHIHLTTGLDDRHVDTGINTFNEDDNP